MTEIRQNENATIDYCCMTFIQTFAITDKTKMMEDAKFWSLMFVALGGWNAMGAFFSVSMHVFDTVCKCEFPLLTNNSYKSAY